MFFGVHAPPPPLPNPPPDGFMIGRIRRVCFSPERLRGDDILDQEQGKQVSGFSANCLFRTYTVMIIMIKNNNKSNNNNNNSNNNNNKIK